MARTHRTHMSPTALRKRGGKQERDPENKPLLKTHKQKRANERAKIRKEYL